jgi:hypothetical protein
MRIVTVTVAIMAGFINAAQAQSPADCGMIANASGQMINAVGGMAQAAESMGEHVPKMRSAATSAQVRASVDKFEDSRRNLVMALRDFVSSSRNMRNSFEACS